MRKRLSGPQANSDAGKLESVSSSDDNQATLECPLSNYSFTKQRGSGFDNIYERNDVRTAVAAVTLNQSLLI